MQKDSPQMAPANGGAAGAARNGDLPPFFRNVITARQPPTERALAEHNVLLLNTHMNEIYAGALELYKQNLRDRAPIILALFTPQGGQMILYRPGHEPLVADRVPIAYELAKSVSHSSMAVFQLVAPYLDNPSDPSWHAPMRAYRQDCQTALEGLDALDLSADGRAALRFLLSHNVAFMDACLGKGSFTYEELKQFARQFFPYFGKTIGLASRAQVAHWMDVLAGWKALLGADWEKVYAATNTLYVTRQNNILYSVLVQYMGQEAIGDRLLLFETSAFTTEPEVMLDVLTRIVADRAVGDIFFKDGYVMDVELIGGGGRRAIQEEAEKRGMKPQLPSLARFRSNSWPWATDPSTGSGASSLDELA